MSIRALSTSLSSGFSEGPKTCHGVAQVFFIASVQQVTCTFLTRLRRPLTLRLRRHHKSASSLVIPPDLSTLQQFQQSCPTAIGGPVSQASIDPSRAELETDVATKSAFVQPLLEKAGQTILGQPEVLDGMLIGLPCRGHVLIEGVPGVAKTLAVAAPSSIS
jgi:hypothetical protein